MTASTEQAAAAVAGRRRNTQAALARVRDVLARMRREKTPGDRRRRQPTRRSLPHLPAQEFRYRRTNINQMVDERCSPDYRQPCG
jgi:hypothetical protein